MKNLTLFLLNLVCAVNVFAETLLIPDNTISFEKYETKCHSDGYLCTQKYFLDQAVAKPTPLFDTFMESLDISNKEFMAEAVKSIQNLLQQEMLSASQLEMLERLLEQLHAANLSRADQLLKEVKFIQQELKTQKTSSQLPEQFVVYFKTVVPATKFIKMKKSYLNIPYLEISFNNSPKNTFSKNVTEETTASLVDGICENATLTINTELPSWKILSNANCGWTKSISNSATSAATTLNNNKGWLLIGALTLGAAMLANHYEVQFQF